jgi:hypothetical protein
MVVILATVMFIVFVFANTASLINIQGRQVGETRAEVAAITVSREHQLLLGDLSIGNVPLSVGTVTPTRPAGQLALGAPYGTVTHRIVQVNGFWALVSWIVPGPGIEEADIAFNKVLGDEYMGVGTKQGNFIRDPRIGAQAFNISGTPLTTLVPDGTRVLISFLRPIT